MAEVDDEEWRKDIIISEPGSRMTIPVHDVSACGRCEYVSESNNIVITPRHKREAMIIPVTSAKHDRELVVEILKRNVRIFFRRAVHENFIVSLGLFAVGRSPGHQRWYLFQCANCAQFSRSYLHGYSRHLDCEYCDGRMYPEHTLAGERD